MLVLEPLLDTAPGALQSAVFSQQAPQALLVQRHTFTWVSHRLHFSLELLAILGVNLCLFSAHHRPSRSLGLHLLGFLLPAIHDLGGMGYLLMLDLTLLITVHAPFDVDFHHLHLARLALQLFVLCCC